MLAYLFPNFTGFLISISQIVNPGLTVTYCGNFVTMFKDNVTIHQGARDTNTGLWMIDLKKIYKQRSQSLCQPRHLTWLGSGYVQLLTRNIRIPHPVHIHSNKGVRPNTWLNRKEIAKPPTKPNRDRCKKNDPTMGKQMLAHLQLPLFPNQLFIRTAFGIERNQSRPLALGAIIVMLRLHLLLRHNLAHCIRTSSTLKTAILFTRRQRSHGQHKTC